MAQLRFEKFKITGANLGPQSEYPILYKQKMFEKAAELDEDEGLFINYGKMYHTLPYASLDSYDRARTELQFDAAVLENERLRAVFLPGLGGRLWSLYDKREKRDLVVENPVFQPCNFAVRNAWVSGGIEWNCGIRGHSPLTCDKVCAASAQLPDGEPVLRMYAFERVRAVTFQMDFFLRDDLPFLFARMRLVNNSDQVTPVYWWSTTAVMQQQGARVIVPADETYVNKGSDPVYKTAIPMVDGVDLSYPTNHPIAMDHFYKIPESARKYEAYVFEGGKGVVQASTRRLAGRKLFVWGTSTGGNNWQRFLTGERGYEQPYVEIQAGLAATQNESLPMPPNTAWEWLEAYGPVCFDPSAVHGDWQTAKDTVQSWLDQALPEATLDKLLGETREMAKTPAPLRVKGHAWGALDAALQVKLGRRSLSGHLDFGGLEEAQALWFRFLQSGSLDEPNPKTPPASFMVQQEWFQMLQDAVEGADAANWFAWYQLGLGYFARDLHRQAEQAFARSVALSPSSFGYHALAATARMLGRDAQGARLMEKARRLNENHLPLAKETLRFAYEAGEFGLVLAVYDALPKALQMDKMVQMYRAFGLAHTGQLAQAKDILLEGGGIEIPDLREGNDALCDEYIFIERALAAARGEIVAGADVHVPESIDYRMFHDSHT